ncbi:MAG: Hsp20/alpha crystallin family protein [Planctomycetes bacterium]|nr:Hsp20/alpha crystallin family protein [Planctomycetota bacterium]
MTTKHSHSKTSDTGHHFGDDKVPQGPMRFTELFISSSKLISVYTEKAWSPPTDIYETDKDIVIRCELAGMKPEEISISFDVNSNHLLISGCRDERDARTKRNFRQMEINYGKFEKAVDIYCGIEPEKASASYKDGFLELVIPKTKKSAGHHTAPASDGHLTIRHIEIISGPITCQEGEDE